MEIKIRTIIIWGGWWVSGWQKRGFGDISNALLLDLGSSYKGVFSSGKCIKNFIFMLSLRKMKNQPVKDWAEKITQSWLQYSNYQASVFIFLLHFKGDITEKIRL